ncbi:MAG: response regulator [Oscillospiraceae bacterium]|nr:response regulator [Oscillospiraceae bacterium]
MSELISFGDDLRILVVDDSEINLLIASGVISTFFGMKCDVALSGAEAVALVEKNSYNLIFMDHMMPGTDGVKTTAIIRGMSEALAHIPIIALTADDSDEIKKLLLESGMNDFLSKPIVVEKVGAILKKWLSADSFAQNAEVQASDIPSSSDINDIESIEGLDTKAGLSCVAFNKEVYIDSLKLLAKKIPDIVTICDKCLSENNPADFATHAHGIKGSLSAVGAIPLSLLAKELETAGKAGDIDFCKANYPNFTASLNDLQEKLAAVFARQSDSQSNSVGTQTVFDDCLKELAFAVDNYDYELITSILARLAELNFNDEINSRVALMKQAAQNFDYEGIKQIISEKR